MATMMLMLINFNSAQPLSIFFSINCIAANSWLPPVISQIFHPGHTIFVTVWLFLCRFHFFLYFIRPQNQPIADYFEICFYSHFFLCRYNDGY